MVGIETFDGIGKPMLEPAASAIEAEAKSTEGAAEGTTRLPLLGL